jgi:acetyl esterase/lipase
MPSPSYEKVRRILLERRSATPASDDIDVLRARLDDVALEPEPDVTVEVTGLDGIPAERVASACSRDGRAILYAHGGGFCLGSPVTHRKLAGEISRAAESACYVVDYRRAPEYPLPAAIEDMVGAYKCLLRTHHPASMLIAGDSAGATLGILAMTRLRDEDVELPAGAIAITPWVDYDCEDPSYKERADGDPITDVGELRGYQRWFLDGYRADDPAICPLTADLSGLPPLIIYGGGGDVMCNDAARLAERARIAEIDVTHRQVPEMMHVWHVFAGRVPESTEAVADLGAFASRRFEARERRPVNSVVG